MSSDRALNVKEDLKKYYSIQLAASVHDWIVDIHYWNIDIHIRIMNIRNNSNNWLMGSLDRKLDVD